MDRVFRIFVLLLAAVFAVACNPAAKFAVLEVDQPYFNGLTSVHTRATVENSSPKDLAVESATLFFAYKKRQLATARLMLPQTAPANSVERVRVDLRLESESLSHLQTLQRRAETNPDQLFVSLKARVRYGRVRRTVELHDVPYSVIIANFGPIIAQ